MTAPIAITFLRDKDHGGDAGQPRAIARQLAGFIETASTSLDIAIYDFRPCDLRLLHFGTYSSSTGTISPTKPCNLVSASLSFSLCMTGVMTRTSAPSVLCLVSESQNA